MRYAGARQLTVNAKELLFQLILEFLKIIRYSLYKQMYIHKQITRNDIQFVFSEVFTGSILENISGTNKTIFSVPLFYKFLKEKVQIRKKDVEWICFAIEYFIFDILDCANSICISEGKIRITEKHIMNVIETDPEISFIFEKNHVYILDKKGIIKQKEFYTFVKEKHKISRSTCNILCMYYEQMLLSILKKTKESTNKKIIQKEDLQRLKPQTNVSINDYVSYEEIEREYTLQNMEERVREMVGNDVFENTILDVQII
jgi:histone H3/H4